MRKTLLPLLVILGLLSGCASLAGQLIEKPRISFDRLIIRDVSLTGQTLVFCFKVANPNRLSLRLVNLDYELGAGGQELGLGRLKAPLTVAGGSSAVIELPLRLDHLRLLSGAGEILRAGSLDYRLNATVQAGVISLPLVKRGQVELPRLPSLEGR